MLIIGLTGSISTGKSTVASLLLSSAWSPFIFHIDADQIARQVVEPGKPAFREIVDYFGPDILKQQDGTIDREKLGGLIFGDAGKRRKLNGFTHGRILREMVRLTLVALLCGNRVCLWDVPLLIEGGMQKWLPVTIVVFCSPETQLSRLLSRNPELSKEAAEARIASQIPVSEKRKKATHEIDNSTSKEDTKRQVEEVMKQVVPGRVKTVVWWALLAVPAVCGLGLLKAWDLVDSLLVSLRTKKSNKEESVDKKVAVD